MCGKVKKFIARDFQIFIIIFTLKFSNIAQFLPIAQIFYWFILNFLFNFRLDSSNLAAVHNRCSSRFLNFSWFYGYKLNSLTPSGFYPNCMIDFSSLEKFLKFELASNLKIPLHRAPTHSNTIFLLSHNFLENFTISLNFSVFRTFT